MAQERLLERRFTNLIARPFKSLGFLVAQQERNVDLLVSSANARAVVEVKLYRSLNVSFSTFRNAAARVLADRQRDGSNYAVIVTSARINELTRSEIRDQESLVVYDYDVLSALFGRLPELAAEFEAIIREAFNYRSEPLPAPLIFAFNPIELTSKLRQPYSDDGSSVPISFHPFGHDLCEEIKSLPPGKSFKRAAAFEGACFSALKYLFEDDFSSWLEQQQTDSGLHRFDVIARISSKSDFWNSLISDFRTRYVIFEMKNYKERITQKEIYSSEKYLYPPAMRGTAIIISRRGADTNALAAARGALREAGKLIINISIDDLCEMLHRKDAGDDPIPVLSDHLDRMLIRLER